MPEIKNELPSDEQLAAYLDECFEHYFSYSFFTDSGKQQDCAPEVIEAYSYLFSHPEWPTFLPTFKNAIYKSLRRLNELPRSDPFWHNTNLRPTYFKLTDFCGRILASDPDDRLSLLTRAAMDVFQRGEFEAQHWMRLYLLGVVSLDAIILAGMFLALTEGNNDYEISKFAGITGTASMLVPLLEEISKHGGVIFSEWSTSVKASLEASAH